MLSVTLTYMFFSFCLCISLIYAETPPEDYVKPEQEKGVYILTNTNFNDFIKYHDNALIEFYAPWCGHCKSLAPQYEAAAEALKNHEPEAVLAKVDATVETELAKRFEVSGYPTIKFFKDAKENDYDGPRTTDGIVKYMKERSDPNWKPPPDAVITLTSDNFHETVDKEELILVEFYAPWCGHCKALAPTYEKAAKALKENDPPIPLAKVDATVTTDIAKEYGVTGYPTIKVFRKGRATDYNGPRDENGIIEYMIGQVGDGSTEKASLADVKKSMKNDDVTIVAFLSGRDDPAFLPYMDVANELRDDFRLVHTFDGDARTQYGVKPGSVVVFTAERFYTKHEPKWHILHKDGLSAEEVKKFVTKHRVPLVGHYSSQNSEKRYSSRPLCLVFYTVDWSFDHRDATQLWRRKVAEIAKDYPGVTFAITDEDDSSEMMKDLGLADSGEEINIGIFDADGRKFPMEPMEEFEPEDVRNFLDDFLSGKLKPHLKSQVAPKKQDGPVTVVVGTTFEEIVNDRTKDVLVMFYAPWCGHCKKLMPVMKKLGKTVEKEGNVVIAKIDSTANDVPSTYKVDGFPTIYYVASDKKQEPVKYDGARDVDSFVTYLKEHATVSFDKQPSAAKEEL